VRDLVVQPRVGDLVIATHGRGIWILDDLTPLRSLSGGLASKEIALIDARPARLALSQAGGWVEGAASFVGDNPTEEAIITYWQAKRHIFGPFKIEVLDDKGVVLEQLTGSKRRGLNRVSWSMRQVAPRAPRGATMAWEASLGPTVLPGTYTVRITRGATVVEKKLEVLSHPNSTASNADLVARNGVIAQVFALLEDMAFFTARIEQANAAILQGKANPTLDAWVADAEALRRKVVATKEGGAITGEERLREFSATLYGSLTGFDGVPTEEQKRYATTLRAEFGDVEAQWAKLAGPRLEAVNALLPQKVELLDRAAWDKQTQRKPGAKGPSLQRYREKQRERFRLEPDEEEGDETE